MVWCLYSYFVHGLEAWDCLSPTVGLKVLRVHLCGYLPLIFILAAIASWKREFISSMLFWEIYRYK